jgi:uncharacterized protein
MEATALLVLQVVVYLLMLVGLVTLIIPVLPGLTVIWAAVLLYDLAVGFTLPAGIIFVILTVMMLAGNIVDNVIVGAHVRQTSTSWLAIFLALLAGIAGTIFFPPLGGLLGALLTLFLVELIRLRDWRRALESSRSMVAGLGWSSLIRFGIGLLMIILWALGAYVLK